MFTNIHETAVIDPNASLGRNVKIGPYAIVGKNVCIDDNTRIGAHAIIEGWTMIGKNCTIHPYVSIGAEPQDKKFRGERSYVVIGDNTQIREFVTVNRATGKEQETRIGSHCLILAYSHVAHNCIVGNHVVISSGTMLAGHVELEDRVTMGGMCGVHQFVKIGCNAMVGGTSKVVQDVPPFILIAGNPAQAVGLNIVGMVRSGINETTRQILKKAYKILYLSRQRLPDALDMMQHQLSSCQELDAFIRFLKNTERGICRSSFKFKKQA